jgi:hypothetical protein
MYMAVDGVGETKDRRSRFSDENDRKKSKGKSNSKSKDTSRSFAALRMTRIGVLREG